MFYFQGCLYEVNMDHWGEGESYTVSVLPSEIQRIMIRFIIRITLYVCEKAFVTGD